ncbi:MAG: peptidoglycan-binding protein, partial [Acidimicrobiia bacterium]|nr:peptidoglycan-binding protein [Acidimicrobiia bacterium]
MRRGLVLSAVLIGLAATATVGWMVGRGIRSPAEIAAQTQPPEPSLITVAVVRTELSADVITRADIGFD